MKDETKRSLSLSLYPSTKERLKEYKEKTDSNYDETINRLIDIAEGKQKPPTIK